MSSCLVKVIKRYLSKIENNVMNKKNNSIDSHASALKNLFKNPHDMNKIQKKISVMKGKIYLQEQSASSVAQQCFYIYRTISNAIIDSNDDIILSFCLPSLANEILNRPWYGKNKIHWRIVKVIDPPNLISVVSEEIEDMGPTLIALVEFNYQQIYYERDCTNKLLKGSLDEIKNIHSYHIFFTRFDFDGKQIWSYACPYENTQSVLLPKNTDYHK